LRGKKRDDQLIFVFRNDFGTEYELSGMTNLDSKKVGVEADLPTRLYCGHEINVSGSWVGT